MLVKLTEHTYVFGKHRIASQRTPMPEGPGLMMILCKTTCTLCGGLRFRMPCCSSDQVKKAAHTLHPDLLRSADLQAAIAGHSGGS